MAKDRIKLFRHIRELLELSVHFAATPPPIYGGMLSEADFKELCSHMRHDIRASIAEYADAESDWG